MRQADYSDPMSLTAADRYLSIEKGSVAAAVRRGEIRARTPPRTKGVHRWVTKHDLHEWVDKYW